MPDDRIPLFVRLPRDQAAALDRLAYATGRRKQHVISELLADRLTTRPGPISVGRIEVASASTERADDVLTLEEAAALLKLPADAVRARAEEDDLPGRVFGKEWRFARTAVLAWLGRRRAPKTQTHAADRTSSPDVSEKGDGRR